MKQLYSLLFLLFAAALTFGQSSLHPDFEKTYDHGNWVKLKEGVSISPTAFFDRYKSALGFDEEHSIHIYKSYEDDYGLVHHRAKQRIHGIPVEGAELILHTRGNSVRHANGKLVKGNLAPAQVAVDEAEAIQLATQYLDAPSYLWQTPGMETLVKRIKNDPSATFYPQPELVWADESYSPFTEKYQLAWKMEIYAADPVGTKEVFVNALDGSILYTLEGCQHTSVTGTAETRYHGTQQMVTDSVSPTEYRLRDYTRGSGIETYNMNEGTDYDDAVDFVDADNYWNNANADFDDAATDVHWGMGQTYDYYLQAHGRDSYDDDGAVIISYVHYDNAWFNASWNGMFARFGDGNGNPLTSIDVVSHELTHGVTRESSGLIYRDESGALNESYSDIFGTLVEFFALGDSAEWLIGKVNFTLRDMSNPNAFNDPDTYLGDFYQVGGGDNGGVHTNSGVQNYWFYLMSEGGAGTNDNGDDYNIPGLGMENAAKIAYQNQVAYLTPTSTYYDARLGAIQSAEDIYGSCSAEVLQTAKAWFAVGVGPDTLTRDLQILSVSEPNTGCSNGQADNITVTFRYNPSGCGFVVDPGTEIQLGYRVDAGPAVTENLSLVNGLMENEEITHTFSNTVDLTNSGSYELDFWVNLDLDEFAGNDTIFDHFVRRPTVIDVEGVITFEPFGGNATLDSFYLVDRFRSSALVNFTSAFSGFRGVQLTGDNRQGLSDIDFPSTPADVFTTSPDYNAQICLCADLTDWTEAYLQFDLRQTFSKYYTDSLGINDASEVIGLHLLVDGVPFGPSFHPQTVIDDDWDLKTVDFSSLTGTSFNLCLEGKHFFSSQNDPEDDSPGDNSYIDNIRFTTIAPVAINYLDAGKFSIAPNPTNGQVRLDLPGDMEGNIEIHVSDALGQQFGFWTWEPRLQGQRIPLNLESLSSGMYFITLSTNQGRVTKKIVVE